MINQVPKVFKNHMKVVLKSSTVHHFFASKKDDVW